MHTNRGLISRGFAGRIIALFLAAMLALSCLTCASAEAGGRFPDAYAAYAGVLKEYETNIRKYWQGGGKITDDGYAATVEPRAIVLEDVMGDDTPELIFIARENGYSAALYIYAYQDGSAKQLICHSEWDTFGGSSSVSCVYLAEDTGELSGANAGNYDGFYRWTSEDGVTLKENSVVRKYDGDYPMTSIDGMEVENGLYDVYIGNFSQSARKLLIYSIYTDSYGYSDWDGRELIGAVGENSSAMTFDEAMAVLSGGAANETDREEAAIAGEETEEKPPQWQYEGAGPMVSVAAGQEPWGQPSDPAGDLPEYRAEYAEAYAAYADVLLGSEDAIRQYYQAGGQWYTPYQPVAEPRAIALADFMGDDVPELIFAKITSTILPSASLNIYTFRDGEAVEVASIPWDDCTQFGLVYPCVGCVYLAEGETAGQKALAAATIGRESNFYYWSSWDGIHVEERQLIERRGPSDSEYWYDDAEVHLELTQSAYEARRDAFPKEPVQLLLYSHAENPHDKTVLDGRDAIGAGNVLPTAMTFDEAMTLFSNGDYVAAEAARANGAAAGDGVLSIESVSVAPVAVGSDLDDAFADMQPLEPSSVNNVQDSVEMPEGFDGEVDIPPELVDVRLTYFSGARDSDSITIREDGYVEFTSSGITGAGNGGVGTYGGWIDRTQKLSDHAYRLRIATVETLSTETYGDVESWDEQPYDGGQVIIIVLPGADEGELQGGAIVPTIEQMEMYGPESAVFDNSYYYVGYVNESGNRVFYPYETW